MTNLTYPKKTAISGPAISPPYVYDVDLQFKATLNIFKEQK